MPPTTKPSDPAKDVMPKGDSMKGGMKGGMKGDSMKGGAAGADQIGSGMTGRGANRGNVEAMQQALKNKGFDPGDIDGQMGPKTQGALKEFQQKEGLRTSGQLDAETRSKLGMQGAGRPMDPAMPSATPSRPPQTR